MSLYACCCFEATSCKFSVISSNSNSFCSIFSFILLFETIDRLFSKNLSIELFVFFISNSLEDMLDSLVTFFTFISD